MHGWRVVLIVRIVGHMRELVARVPSCRSGSQGPPCHTTATDERRTVRQGWGTLEENGGDHVRDGRVCRAGTPGAVRVLVLFSPARARGAMTVPHAYPGLCV